MTLLGQVSLWVSLLVAAWGALVGALGLRTRSRALLRSAARAPAVLAVLLAVTGLSLVTGLVRFDPRMAYVVEHAHRALPQGYRALAFVTTVEGGIVACLFVAALAVAYVQWAAGGSDGARAAGGLPLLALAAALLAIVAARNPFAVLERIPVDGSGFDPALRHPLLGIGPPLVLLGGGLGLAAWSAHLGSAATGATSAAARGTTRAGALAMTAGLLAIAWWSYGSAGWGLGWVPLDGALAPWPALLALATLSPRRAHLELPLTALAALLILVGLFVVPDHLTPRDGAAGTTAVGWMIVMVAALPLILPLPLGWITRGEGAAPPTAPTRESRVGTRITVLGLALVLVAVVAVALAGGARVIELAPGASTTVETRMGGPYTVRQLDVSSFSQRDHVARIASARVALGDRQPRFVASEWRQYVDVTGAPLGEPVVRPGTHRGVLADLQLVVSVVLPDGSVRYRVRSYPLTGLAFIGGVLLLVGGVLLVVPGRWS